jgi:Zn-dependent membrane protease YugP
MLQLRSQVVPVLSFAAPWMQWILFAGIIFLKSFPELMLIGICLFGLTTLFSFITLPVEINASARAVKCLDRSGIVNYEAKPMAVNALKWAAYTYVIAALASLAQLV